MLFIFLGLFILGAVFFGIMQSVKGDFLDDAFGLLSGTFIILAITIFIVTFFVLGLYNETKTTTDKQILILEERNELVLKQVEPIINKYLTYEGETLEKLKVSGENIIALSMYSELKSNDFLKSQIDIVVKNQGEITKLKLSKAELNAYKLWIFMGE